MHDKHEQCCAPRSRVCGHRSPKLLPCSICSQCLGMLSHHTTPVRCVRTLSHHTMRRYIYNHKACGRCGTPVRTWDMSARTCYACEVCQPLQQGTILDAKRTKALSAAKDSKVSPPI